MRNESKWPAHVLPRSTTRHCPHAAHPAPLDLFQRSPPHAPQCSHHPRLQGWRLAICNARIPLVTSLPHARPAELRDAVGAASRRIGIAHAVELVQFARWSADAISAMCRDRVCFIRVAMMFILEFLQLTRASSVPWSGSLRPHSTRHSRTETLHFNEVPPAPPPSLSSSSRPLPPLHAFPLKPSLQRPASLLRMGGPS